MKLKLVSVKSRINRKELPVIARELRAIQSEVSVITPEEVVKRAASPKSPLHKYFEWDDGVAAEAYRRWQARELIINVHIVDSSDEDAQPIRAFVNLKPDQDDDFIAGQGYVYTPTISSRVSYQNQVLLYAKAQLVRWREKFGGYKQFFGVVKEIDKIK